MVLPSLTEPEFVSFAFLLFRRRSSSAAPPDRLDVHPRFSEWVTNGSREVGSQLDLL